ncbi:MAG: YHYH domain-containing protein [Novosphingobium sp.]|nr:YHYH domain-containing protein [Novosphingobium sp.]
MTIAAPALAHEEKPKASNTVPAPAPKPAAEPTSDRSTSPQHSGGTDANGCHTNHATGVYHCHNPK